MTNVFLSFNNRTIICLFWKNSITLSFSFSLFISLSSSLSLSQFSCLFLSLSLSFSHFFSLLFFILGMSFSLFCCFSLSSVCLFPSPVSQISHSSVSLSLSLSVSLYLPSFSWLPGSVWPIKLTFFKNFKEEQKKNFSDIWVLK